jgi:hypothetical protein
MVQVDRHDITGIERGDWPEVKVHHQRLQTESVGSFGGIRPGHGFWGNGADTVPGHSVILILASPVVWLDIDPFRSGGNEQRQTDDLPGV